MRAGENRSDVEKELESEDPIEVRDDMIFSEEEKNREVIATSVERRDPMATSTGGEQEAERRGDVAASRKCAAGADAVDERDAKRTRSLCPSEVSPASSPPAVGVAGQARRSEEQARTHVLSGPVPARDS